MTQAKSMSSYLGLSRICLEVRTSEDGAPLLDETWLWVMDISGASKCFLSNNRVRSREVMLAACGLDRDRSGSACGFYGSI